MAQHIKIISLENNNAAHKLKLTLELDHGR
jgi:hypothetical protein